MMSVGDLIQSGIFFLMFVGIFFSIFQLRKISHSIMISQQANIVSVISHCGDRYEKLFSDLPEFIDNKRIDVWWYRYWDLYTSEFNLFLKSLIDPTTFELWMNELANVYQESPAKKREISIRADAHKEYLKNTLPHFKELRDFFYELDSISKLNHPQMRAELVHDLVVKYSPQKGPFIESKKRKRIKRE